MTGGKGEGRKGEEKERGKDGGVEGRLGEGRGREKKKEGEKGGDQKISNPN